MCVGPNDASSQGETAVTTNKQTKLLLLTHKGILIKLKYKFITVKYNRNWCIQPSLSLIIDDEEKKQLILVKRFYYG